jgi:hypothetical protein
VAGRDVARSSGSETCFQWAEEQLNRCLKEHKPCAHAPSHGAQLPTRVLDLQFFSDSNDLRLYESGGATGAYATLSHRWGTAAKPLMTELATIHLRYQRISFGDLPRSFQDAVIISRKLKIRYLWIDTLCIIQDSLDDWAMESAQMARIYKSALLTISFTDYQDAHQPVLCDRPELPTCRMGGEMSHVRLRSQFPYRDDPTPQNLSVKLLGLPSEILGHSSPLGRRAWAFQERLLSSRLLSYTNDQLIWECQQLAKCESVVLDLKPHLKVPDLTFEKEAVYRYWLGVVASFSRCDLTFARDKFPALSGIASEVGNLVADTYLAGLWKSDLHGALLWIPSLANTSPVAQYRAPSWSWASVDGDIRYNILNEGYMGERRVRRVHHDRDMVVLHHSIHPATSDPFGMIDEASLTVRGYCAEANSIELTAGSPSGETVDLLPVPIPGRDGAVLSEWQFDTRAPQHTSRSYVLLQVSRWGLVIKVSIGDMNDEDDSFQVPDKYEAPCISTLILEKADRDGEYRRVGIADIRDQHRGKIQWEQRELTLV